MNFEPFDTGLIRQHLREAVSALQIVGGAADYAAVKELRSFRTPSAYVIFAEERNTGKVPASVNVCAQESVVEFGVVLALRHWRETRGEQMQDDMRALVGIAALVALATPVFAAESPLQPKLWPPVEGVAKKLASEFPKPIYPEFGDKIVGVVKYLDGTALDSIREVKNLDKILAEKAK